MLKTPYPHRHSARIATPYAALIATVRPMLASMDLTLSDTATGAEADLGEAFLTLEDAGAESRLTVSAASAVPLANLRETITFMLAQTPAPHQITWDATQTAGAPANFTLARLSDTRRLSPSFQRIRLEGDFTRFMGDALHFRFAFGPEGAGWPQADATGAVTWDGGTERWFRPAYTVRAIDPEARWIDIDIVLHDGGRVTDWVARAAVGDAVGLTGPGGKVPQSAGWIAYLGDETALPVIARGLERLPAETRGRAALFVPDAADRQPLTAPEGVEITWHVHGQDAGPLDVLASLTPPEEDSFVFFAGERDVAAEGRKILEGKGLRKGTFHCGVYWTDGWSPPDEQIKTICRIEA